jgi:hypothetical protein
MSRPDALANLIASHDRYLAGCREWVEQRTPEELIALSTQFSDSGMSKDNTVCNLGYFALLGLMAAVVAAYTGTMGVSNDGK